MLHFSMQVLQKFKKSQAKMMKHSIIQLLLLIIKQHSLKAGLVVETLKLMMMICRWIPGNEGRITIFLKYGGINEVSEILKTNIHSGWWQSKDSKKIIILCFEYLLSLSEDAAAKRQIISFKDIRESATLLLRIPLEKQDKELRNAAGDFMRDMVE